MRISLLLRREPFVEILTDTLETFWKRRVQGDVAVRWWENTGRPRRQRANVDGAWWCNIYLNAIFPRQVDRSALDVVRREFAHSVVAWRRPFQRAYVALALGRRTAGWFAQAALDIRPCPDNQHCLLIIPGNQKIRILDRESDSTFALLKHGFDDRFFRQEITSRRLAQQQGLPVPALVKCNVEEGWFEEQYVVGTPLNRLKSAARVRPMADQARSELSRLHAATVEETSRSDYVEPLCCRIEDQLTNNKILDSAEIDMLTHECRRLAGQVCQQGPSGSRTMNTTICHGDFQPANILVAGPRLWLIDWEYSDRRQSSYDWLVNQCSSRQPRGLADRLHRYVEHGFTATECGVPEITGFDCRRADERHFQATLFLLEELHLRLAENANPRFTRAGMGLSQLAREIAAWN